MNSTHHVPPGFRFHPTDEELVDYYLRRKVNSTRIDLDVIKDVDLYKIEPWDLQEVCRVGREEENEWYFFSHKDKKYPTGTRTNRATAAGFWKATGRDKAIYSNSNSNAKHELIGMRKTLVFYKGRAPNGLKSDWIMHEYRLETDENNGTTQEEGWVVCRVFKKRVATTTMNMKHDSPSCTWYDDQQVSFMHQDHYFVDSSSSSSSSKQIIPHHPPPPPPNYNYNNNNLFLYHHQQQQQEQMPFPNCNKKLLEVQPAADHHFLHQHQLPLLDNHNPNKLLPYDPASMILVQPQHDQDALVFGNNNNTSGEQSSSSVVAADWRVLDKFVSSQLISQQEDHLLPPPPQTNSNNDASTSNSSSPMDLVWK